MGERRAATAAADRSEVPASCAHCGRSFTLNQGPGRPARYCRRSCRQRAFEARRHAGDQAWSDARLIQMADQLARHEDALDRVVEVIDELRRDVADDRPSDAAELAERLSAAVRLER